MDGLIYRDSAEKKDLFFEGVSLAAIAREHGTPAYVYSAAVLRQNLASWQQAFKRNSLDALGCFALKANPNLHLLREIFRAGFGADVVSVGELERALRAGLEPSRIVFSGVGKTRDDLARALDCGIYSINVESLGELQRIESLNRPARIALRVNPNIDAKTHPHIATGLTRTKFGIPTTELPRVIELLRQSRTVKLVGLACHIGSQITELSPFEQMANFLVTLWKDLCSVDKVGTGVEFLDLGGGVGIRYFDEEPPTIDEYVRTIAAAVRTTGRRVLFEPGRSIVGSAGLLLTEVQYTKSNGAQEFAVVDAAMSELIRPALYEAFHHIVPVQLRPRQTLRMYDVVGPICESADFFGKDRQLPELVSADLVAILTAGAYGMSMASHYNARLRCPEVLVDGNQMRVISRRETVEELWRLEE